MLFAVHISDGPWDARWLIGGFVLTAFLLWIGVRKLRDEEIPRLALMTAAFFVASEIRIPVPPTSIHLLLGGLIGVMTGMRAALAIFIGLLLQAVLLGHGGFYTLGVNTCVMTAPALMSFVVFQALHRILWIKTPVTGSLLVGFSALVWFMTGMYSLTLVCNTPFTQLEASALQLANERLFDPWVVGAGLLFAVGVTLLERKLGNTPAFPLGFLIGVLSVLSTAGLNCVVLLAMGEKYWPTPPLILMLAHLPFAVVEGVILGFVVGFLATVKPDLLGITSLKARPAGDIGDPLSTDVTVNNVGL